MKTKFYNLLIVFICFFTILTFVASLLLSYVRFTVYDSDAFINNVSSHIDSESIKQYTLNAADTISYNCGFPVKSARNVIGRIDFNRLPRDYFSLYYKNFIDGNSDVPYVEFYTHDFVREIENEYKNSARPDIYSIDENREFLADKYNEAVKLSVSSLSVQRIYKILLGYRENYLRICSIGAFFTPVVIAFAVFLITSVALIIMSKRVKTLYFLFLSLFTASAFFAIPFTYLKNADLPSKLNLNFGSANAYIGAIWNLTVVDAASAFTAISIIIAAVLAAIIVFIVSLSGSKKT